jgi:hypothetical protein
LQRWKRSRWGEIAKSEKLKSIVNKRNKNLAHSLSQTNIEKAGSPVGPMKYGYERGILEASTTIVEQLHFG